MTAPANLILFLSDNHNGMLMGNAGHPLVRTPAMDRIAARGTRFANSYCASPLCCPSRAAIACGRFPHQTGYWDNCLAYDGRVASWGHRVRESGGSTVSVGKLHFRSSDDDNGFDQEIAPMHIVGGTGALTHLLRWSGEQPPTAGQWDLYWARSGVGETEYQHYDREITRLAVKWLHDEGRRRDRPWVLLVSYVSSHPPFTVPQRLFDLYPVDAMPLPVCHLEHERPDHPALEYLRTLQVYQDMDDPRRLRQVAAGYFALISHLDEQIGQVMQAAQELSLLERTRILYTSDHGESFGNHGLFGKNHLLEPAVRVPLLMSGPGIASGATVQAPVSSTDLFPTIVEATGARPADGDADLPGCSLWRLLEGNVPQRALFAEFHAFGSRSGSFMWRQGNEKLIYHVGMRPQFYDLGTDPLETRDLAGSAEGLARASRLEQALRRFVDPEAVDARAKADQKAMALRHGGTEAILKSPAFVYTPPPGHAMKLEPDPG